jgi:hypothetical protein
MSVPTAIFLGKGEGSSKKAKNMSTQQIQPRRGLSFLLGGVLLASAASGQTAIPHTTRLMQTWQMLSDRDRRGERS